MLQINRINHSLFQSTSTTPPRPVVINGANMCRGFVAVSSRSRVRHSTAEPLRLHKGDQTADSTRSQRGVAKWHMDESRNPSTECTTALSRWALSYNLGLILQPQQGRCLHLGLTTRWKQTCHFRCPDT